MVVSQPRMAVSGGEPAAVVLLCGLAVRGETGSGRQPVCVDVYRQAAVDRSLCGNRFRPPV